MKLLWLFLLLPCLGFSQAPHFSRLSRVIVSGTSHGGGIAVDTSHEAITYALIINVPYNPLRPNKKVILGGDCSFFMNGVPIGDTGDVQFIFTTGTENLEVNGIQNTSPPGMPGLFEEVYNNILSLLNWN